MKRWRALLAFFVSLALLCAAGTHTHAQTRASDYITRYAVSASQGERTGQVSIRCDITAKRSVVKIGVLKIEIYQSNGSRVTTIQGTTSNGLLSPESSFAYIVTYTYKGVPGITYYAKVTLCAGTNSDYDVRYVQTQKVTAPY